MGAGYVLKHGDEEKHGSKCSPKVRHAVDTKLRVEEGNDLGPTTGERW